eukprot:gene9100-biopygen8986
MEDSSFSCPSCPYCLEDLGHCGGPTTLPCGHNGCLECFTLIVNSRDPSCPLCRIPLDPNVPLKQNSQFKEVLEVLARLSSFVSELCLGTAPSPLLTTSDELSPSPTACEQSRAEEECKWPLHPDSLCQACDAGDLEGVQSLLRRGREETYSCPDLHRALHAAAKGGHLECLSAILEHVACVLGPSAPANMVNLKAAWARRSALHEAVVSGQRGCVAALLEAGAKSDEVDAMGDSPLVSATERGDVECALLLLDAGAHFPPNTLMSHTGAEPEVVATKPICAGWTLLYFASWGVPVHHVKATLKRGVVLFESAGLDGPSPRFDSASFLSHLKSSDSVVSVLLSCSSSSASVNAKDIMGMTPLHLAATGGQAAHMTGLLSKGATAEAQDAFGRTPLHHAVRQGHLPCVLALLDHGAKVDTQSMDGHTALHEAVDSGCVCCYAALLSRGAQLESQTNCGWTPLHLAVIRGSVLCCTSLLEQGAKVDAQGCYGWTPLHVAAGRGATDCMSALMDNGAPLSAVDEAGSTPLHQAAAEGHMNCVALLLSHDADVNEVGLCGLTALHECASHGHTDCVELLLSLGAGVHVRCSEGLTPLHCAASRGHAECVSLLLEHDGVDVDARSQDGMTPLLYAARAGSLECVMAVLTKGGSVVAADNALRTALHHTADRDCVLALLTHGAKVSAKAADGSTPLHHAASLRSAGSLIALLDSSAKTNVKCREGLAPLHVAAQHKRSECVVALLNMGAKVNVQGQDAWTALHYAVDPMLKSPEACLMALLNKGARVMPMSDGIPSVHQVAVRGWWATGNPHLHTPQQSALISEDVCCVVALLDKGSKVDAQSVD